MWQTILINLFDSSVRLFTYAQIYCARVVRFVGPMFPSLLDVVSRPKRGRGFTIENTPKPKIQYVSSRGERMRYEPETDNYGFAVVLCGENRRIIHDKNVALDDISFQVCDEETKLMVCELNMRGKTLPLSLKETGRYNYYMMDNTFNHAFWVHFIRMHYANEFMDVFNDTQVNLDDDYFVSVVDNCVNMTKLTSSHIMSIRASGFHYSICEGCEKNTKVLPLKLDNDETRLWETTSGSSCSKDDNDDFCA